MTGAGLNEPAFEPSTFFRSIFSKHLKADIRKTTRKILEELKRNPCITRKELAGIIGISRNGVKYHLDNLKKTGVIERIGSDKGGSWKVRRDL